YKEPSASVDVITSHSLSDLNQHNYVHKMHSLLELEEITRQTLIARSFFCRMHYALDSLGNMQIVFPDIVQFKPDAQFLKDLTQNNLDLCTFELNYKVVLAFGDFLRRGGAKRARSRWCWAMTLMIGSSKILGKAICLAGDAGWEKWFKRCRLGCDAIRI
ncbi:hypothetical protein RRG08_046042, partial [Elysia crispata]